MIGIQLNCEVKPIINKAIEKGILVLSAGECVIRLLPPLVISYEDIDKAIEIFKDILAD